MNETTLDELFKAWREAARYRDRHAGHPRSHVYIYNQGRAHAYQDAIAIVSGRTWLEMSQDPRANLDG